MKNKLIRRMYAILVLTVLFVAPGIFCIVAGLSYSATTADMRGRAEGVVRDILGHVAAGELSDMQRSGAQARLDAAKNVGGLSRLYFARIEDEAIVTSLPDEYVPAGQLADDLRQSLASTGIVEGKGLCRTDAGWVYGIFWPILGEEQKPLGAVCMEFSADSTYQAFRRAALYSLGLSGVCVVIFSIVSYLSMTRAVEPYYKKLAYADLMTGCENRMAFERRMRECAEICHRGGTVSMMIFDVNNLKTVNDTLGHELGDQYLTNTAHTLVEHLGKGQTLYRIGGDEFAALLTKGGEREIHRINDALRRETRSMIKGWRFSCAFGCATYTSGLDGSMRDVFGRADRAMYDEKKRQKTNQRQNEITGGVCNEVCTNDQPL